MEIITRLIRLPLTIEAFTTEDENGEPMIYINDRISREQQETAYYHEVKHIKNGDLHNGKSIRECEGGA